MSVFSTYNTSTDQIPLLAGVFTAVKLPYCTAVLLCCCAAVLLYFCIIYRLGCLMVEGVGRLSSGRVNGLVSVVSFVGE